MPREASVIPLSSPDEIGDSQLRARAASAFRSNCRQFIARTEGEEAGYLSLECYPSQSLAFIYEIFVLSHFRNHGVGSALLSYAEAFAREASFPTLWLRPRSLDVAIEDRLLVEWYTRRGFIWPPGSSDHMEKTLGQY